MSSCVNNSSSLSNITLRLYVHYCQGSGPETFPVSRQHTSPLCVFMIEIETKHIHSCCQTLPSMPSLITIYMLSLFWNMNMFSFPCWINNKFFLKFPTIWANVSGHFRSFKFHFHILAYIDTSVQTFEH